MEEDVPKNKGGRPKKYKTEDLRELLYNYVQRENPAKISVTELVKHTGVPVQAWRFNQEIKNEIDLLNKKLDSLNAVAPVEGVQGLLTIPSAEEIVTKHYGNKTKLIDVLNTFLEVYQYSLEQSLKVNALEKENVTLNQEISSLKQDIEFYKEQMKKMAIQSTSLTERKENNLKDNVIDIKHYSATGKTFKDLFDD